MAILDELNTMEKDVGGRIFDLAEAKAWAGAGMTEAEIFVSGFLNTLKCSFAAPSIPLIPFCP
jgi:hypothetical protein